MRTGRYTLAELFGNRQIEQLVIPEIQRDYVWGKDQTEHLMESILGNFDHWIKARANPQSDLAQGLHPQNRERDESEKDTILKEFNEFYARRRYSTNVGFVYAYSDADLPGQFCLIDGQQRLTTLYLALLVTAAKSDNLKSRFKARYTHGQHRDFAATDSVSPTKLAYRLREHTARFLHCFVSHCLNTNSGEPITDQSWCLHRFTNDATAQNLITNHTVIQALLVDPSPHRDPAQLFGYLEDLVDCWYFDTNESSQGEELYLYLNARGESLAENENMKARLLDQSEDRQSEEEWGKKWEVWQDYFWKHRKTGLKDNTSNPNADRGYNNFLSCVQYLKQLVNGTNAIKAQDLELSEIERYLKVLQWLESYKDEFTELYTYSDWVSDWFDEIWNNLNTETPVDWSVSISDDNKSTERNLMVLVWGTLLSVSIPLAQAGDDFTKLNTEQIFRTIRVFYLRYNNNNRSVTNLLGTVTKALVQTALESDSENEEVQKWKFLEGRPDQERRYLESAIWRIEDHRLNLDGSDVGGVNLIHIVDLAPELTAEQLGKVYDAFVQLFPLEQDKEKEKEVALAVLHYGPFWHRESPWYRENYNLLDWRRTIRGKGSEEDLKHNNQTTFRRFFDEFKESNKNLDPFIKKPVPENIEPAVETDLRRILLWYSAKLGTQFLCEGAYISRNNNSEAPDIVFSKTGAVWTTKGSFKGNRGYKKLSELVSSVSVHSTQHAVA
jgi:hypothetical protein